MPPPTVTVHVPPSTAMSAHSQVPKPRFWPGLEPLRAPEQDLELHSDCMAQTENSSCKRWYFGLVILKIHCRQLSLLFETPPPEIIICDDNTTVSCSSSVDLNAA